MNKTELLLASEKCLQTYGKVPKSVDFVCDSYDKHTDTYCIISYRNGVMFIAFRGTKSFRNWVMLARTRPVRGVHNGVRQMVDAHFKKIADTLLKYPFSKLIITGHSLGGGLAMETARRAYAKGYRNIFLITFGAMQSHTIKEAHKMGAYINAVKVINNNDIVTHLLTRVYDTIGSLLYFDRFGKPHKSYKFFWRLKDAVGGSLGSYKSFIYDGYIDHPMETYNFLLLTLPEDFK